MTPYPCTPAVPLLTPAGVLAVGHPCTPASLFRGQVQVPPPGQWGCAAVGTPLVCTRQALCHFTAMCYGAPPAEARSAAAEGDDMPPCWPVALLAVETRSAPVHGGNYTPAPARHIEFSRNEELHGPCPRPSYSPIITQKDF